MEISIGLPDDEGHVDVYTFDPSTSEYHFATGISGEPRITAHKTLVFRVIELAISLPYLMMERPSSFLRLTGITIPVQ